MLAIHSISGLSVACDIPSDYALLVLESGVVRFLGRDGKIDDVDVSGVYILSGGGCVVSSNCGDTLGELVCFDRISFVHFVRTCDLVGRSCQLDKLGFLEKIEGADLVAIRMDLLLLKKELEVGGDQLRLNLAFSLLMCSVFWGGRELGTANNGDSFADEFNRLLEGNFRRCRSTNFFARRLGISARKLNSWCRGSFSGKGFYAVLIDRLMMEAEFRLLCSDDPIKFIAYELGFRSVQHFRTYFVRYRGISPSGLRLRQRCVVEVTNPFGLVLDREG
jgi:AraC-like DNA-binding protein